jgi:hypothetical protein
MILNWCDLIIEFSVQFEISESFLKIIRVSKLLCAPCAPCYRDFKFKVFKDHTEFLQYNTT